MELNEYIVELVELRPRNYEVTVKAFNASQAAEQAKSLAIEFMGAHDNILVVDKLRFVVGMKNE